MDRRVFLRLTTALAATAVVTPAMPIIRRSEALAATPAKVVDSAAGKLRGLSLEGVQAYLGIPYGAPTGGKARFLPPKKVKPWSGIRDVVAFGDRAPQIMPSLPPGPGSKLWRFATNPTSEDCLVLNVWTPAADGAKRPVMFWCHGGGFASGSAHEPDYDGANLARHNDVVVVSINHRLNVLGYCYLGGIGGADFADSGNAGMLDIVLALEWVRDNIAQFGGDPGNVMIFGQSGGGAKVSALLAMPPANGLFHKAIIMSGPGVRMTERGDAEQATNALLTSLNLGAKDIAKLQALPVDQLVAAGGSLAMPGASRGGRPGFSPVVDGRSLPAHPFDPVAPAVSANIPIVVGYTKDEATTFMGLDPKFGTLSDADLRERAKAMVDEDKVDKVIAAYRKIHPKDSPSYLLTSIMTDQRTGVGSTTIAERKIAQGQAPVYMYYVTWETPILGGKMRSPHGVDMAFVFDNVEVAREGLYGPGPEPQQMADMMSKSWAAFARSGNPSGPGIPSWPAYTLEKREVMVFDVPTKVEKDPVKKERELWASLGAA